MRLYIYIIALKFKMFDINNEKDMFLFIIQE